MVVNCRVKKLNREDQRHDTTDEARTELTGDNYEGFCPSTYREPGDPPELVRGETTPAVLLAGAERKP